MKSRVALLLSIVALIGTLLPVRSGAQSKQDKQDKDESVVLRANEVLLDVVVRDKKGHAIKDLKPGDFEVYEDNVRQDVTSFRLVSRERIATETKTGPKLAPTAPAPTPVGPREPFSNISLVSMVFDHLSADARNLARKAANNFVDESLQPDDQVSICVIDRGLRIVQPYTSDPNRLRQGIDKATTMAVSTVESKDADRRSLDQQLESNGNSLSSQVSSTGQGSTPGNISSAAADQALMTMQARELETFESLERNQHGISQITGLLAIINSLAGVPGRKAIVLFSEGLSLPPDVQVHFPAVINAANRANVSIYSIESGGLRVVSGNKEAADEIRSMGNKRIAQVASGKEDRSGRPMTMGLERAQDLLTLNPQSGLSELSNATGGFLIADTNDLGGGLRRIDEDLRLHYTLTYVPKNTNLDGKFRQINVKLTRGGMDVQTRKGYYALPSMGSYPVLDFEAPALAAMAKGPGDGFSLRSNAFDFPGAQASDLVAVMAEVPSNAFTFTSSADKKTFSSDYTILTVIRNDSQQVVSKLSQHYALPGPIDQIDNAKKGDVLFYKETQLPPGHYTMETIAYDAPSGKASTRTGSFDVIGTSNAKPGLSSLVILKRADKLTPDEQKQANPFHYGEMLIYPNLGEPIGKRAMNNLPFYFSVSVPQGTTTAPKMAIEVLKSGRALAKIPSQLSAPGANGLIQFASYIPLDSFQPGNYELRITVGEGAASVARTVGFTVSL
jgi:VWFA-related protein